MMKELLRHASPDLFENAHQGNALLTKDGHFMCLNRPFCNMLGRTESELLTKRWQDLTHVDDLTADEQSADRVAAGRLTGYDMFKRYIHKDGSIISVKLRICGVKDDAGEFLCFLAMVVPKDDRMTAPPIVITSKDVGNAIRMISWAVEKAPKIAAGLLGIGAVIYYLIRWGREYWPWNSK